MYFAGQYGGWTHDLGIITFTLVRVGQAVGMMYSLLFLKEAVSICVFIIQKQNMVLAQQLRLGNVWKVALIRACIVTE